MRRITIGNKNIGHGEAVYIIAEAGVNHNGDIQLAKELIDAAKLAGADAVKFQTFNTANLVTKSAPKAKYQQEKTSLAETQWDMLKRLELTEEHHTELINYCKSKDITFLSTPFDLESLQMLERLGIEAYKISSGDLINKPFLESIAVTKKPIILSTGMGTLGEIEEALTWIGSNPCVLLHCTTSYPTPYQSVNLRAMGTIQTAFGIPVGYSDHTLGIEVSVAAVALGAVIIEKHITLDKKLQGPDHNTSLDTQEFALMVESIRNVEVSLGTGLKACNETEILNRDIARKSIVSKKSISKGILLDSAMITIKRPGTGIAPKYLDKVIGKVAQKNIPADTPINWDDLY